MCRFPQIRYSHIPQPFYHYILDGVLISAKLITLFRCVECDRYNAYPSSNSEHGNTNLDLYANHPVFISDISDMDGYMAVFLKGSIFVSGSGEFLTSKAVLSLRICAVELRWANDRFSE